MPLSRNRKRQLFIGLPVLLMLFSAAGFWGYKEFRLWRAERMANEARELLVAEKVVEAWNRARSAYFLAPKSLEVTRTLAEVADMGDPSLAPGHWEEAVALSEGAPQDRLGWGFAALKTGRVDIAAEQLEILRAEGYNDTEVETLEVRLLARQGRITQALQKAEDLVAQPGIDQDTHFFYVQLTQYSPHADDRDKGIQHLLDLTRRTDELGLLALRNMAQYPELDSPTLRDLTAKISAHPLRTREDSLLRLQLRLRLPDRDAKVIVHEARQLFDLQDADDLLLLGRWLNQNRLYAYTPEVLGLSLATQRKDLFLIYLDALAFQNEWAQIEELLARPRAPLEDYARYLFMMRVHQQAGDRRKASLAWDKALLAAASNAEQLWYLSRYAERLGFTAYTELALRRLTQLPGARRQAYEKWLLLERRNGTTASLLRVYKEMAQTYPADNTVLNDTLYLSLLLDEDLTDTLLQARQLVEDNPLYLEHRMVLALALLKNDDAATALALLQPLQVDWSSIEHRWRVTFARILQANGYTQQAIDYAKTINPEHLLPEERAILQTVVTG